ncbi:MAG: hypothetical protein WD602_03050 [Actinomycetota bacterium]
MIPAHRFVGLGIAAIFGLLAVWGLVLWIRNRNPGQGFWRVLAAGQIGLAVQVLLGVVMFFVRGGMEPLHYVYGAFPILVLVFAHRMSRRFEGLEWVAFALSGLFIFGLQLRGFMTGSM